MKDVSSFATSAHPLHPSGMRPLMECPWRTVVNFLFAEDGEAGAPADTGSAVHAAAAAMHRGKEVSDCLEEMGARASEYPLADLQEAAGLFLHYAADPRNRDAEVVLCEAHVRFEIAPAPEDPTGAPIVVEGRVDQVRRLEGGSHAVYDIKTSKKEPINLVHRSIYQVAAYCVGASVALGVQVEPGALILPRRYPLAAYWHFAWSFKDIESILEPVRRRVAEVRMGRVHHHPNDDCRWCSQRSPDQCLPRLQDTLALIRR